MLAADGDPRGGDAGGPQVPDAVATESGGDAAGVVQAAVVQPDVALAGRLPQIAPARRPVDGPDVTGGRVGVGEQELPLRRAPKIAQDDAEDAALAVAGEGIAQPEPGQRRHLLGAHADQEAMAVPRPAREHDPADERPVEEDPVAPPRGGRHAVQVVVLDHHGSHHRRRHALHQERLGDGARESALHRCLPGGFRGVLLVRRPARSGWGRVHAASSAP